MGTRGQTEGGEALLLLEKENIGGKGPQRWYALWTHSHCEQLVRNQLDAKGFELFLPTVTVWSKRAGARHRIRRPLFPGYLFLRDQLSGQRYLEILKAKGLVGILGGRNGSPDRIEDAEIDAIRALVFSDLRVLPHPYLRTGQRVRITDGPLAEVEGILVDRRPARGLLVLSIHLFRRSVAVEVDYASAVAA